MLTGKEKRQIGRLIAMAERQFNAVEKAQQDLWRKQAWYTDTMAKVLDFVKERVEKRPRSDNHEPLDSTVQAVPCKDQLKNSTRRAS